MKDRGPQDRKKTLLNRLLSSINFMVSEDLNTRDHRSAARVEFRAEVQFVDMNGQKGSGVLIDISKSGLQMETTMRLGKGTTLAIRAPEDETLEKTAPFMATVKWCRKGENSGYGVGLALPPEVVNDPHWLESLLSQLGYDEDDQRREFIRAKSEISGSLKIEESPESETISVEVKNLGMGGALLRTDEVLEKNDSFLLSLGPVHDLPLLEIRGTILRAVEKDDQKLYPSSFQVAEEEDSKLLQEYILKFSDR